MKWFFGGRQEPELKTMNLKACAHLPPNLTLGFNAKVVGPTLVPNMDPKQGRLRRVSTWKSDAEKRKGTKSFFPCVHWKRLTWIRSPRCCCSWRVSPALAWPRQRPCPPEWWCYPHPAALWQAGDGPPLDTAPQ